MERKADVLHCMGDLWECIPHRFPINLSYGKHMERKADVLYCMGDLWECILHRFPIALTFLFALKFAWK